MGDETQLSAESPSVVMVAGDRKDAMHLAKGLLFLVVVPWLSFVVFFVWNYLAGEDSNPLIAALLPAGLTAGWILLDRHLVGRSGSPQPIGRLDQVGGGAGAAPIRELQKSAAASAPSHPGHCANLPPDPTRHGSIPVSDEPPNGIQTLDLSCPLRMQRADVRSCL